MYAVSPFDSCRLGLWKAKNVIAGPEPHRGLEVPVSSDGGSSWGSHIKECIRPGLATGDNGAHSAGPTLCWAAVLTGHFSMAVAATPATGALQLKGVESYFPLG